jgi:hypothetical protein
MVGNYVGHASTIEIIVAYESQFLVPTLKILYQKLHGWLVVLSSIVHDFVHKINVIFGVSLSKDETCFEQINVYCLFFHIPIRFCNLFIFSWHVLANLFEDCVCKCNFDRNCHAFTHLMCHWKKQKTLLFGGQSMKRYFLQLPILKKTILTMLASQIETKRVFSIARIFTCLVDLDLVWWT